MPTKKATFEQNISELEQIVTSLENADVPLNDCISLFEKGVKLSGECLKMLDTAQQKVKVLTDNKLEDFTTENI